MEFNKVEKEVLACALINSIEERQNSLIKRMENKGFSNYRAPALGIETDETFIKACMHYYPQTTERYLAAVELYEKLG